MQEGGAKKQRKLYGGAGFFSGKKGKGKSGRAYEKPNLGMSPKAVKRRRRETQKTTGRMDQRRGNSDEGAQGTVLARRAFAKTRFGKKLDRKQMLGNRKRKEGPYRWP